MFREDGNIIFIALFVICLGLFAFFLAVAGKICHLYQASKSAVLSLFAIVCGFWILFDMMLTVGVGEVLSCGVLGTGLLTLLQKYRNTLFPTPEKQ